jgi:hypothetical protein
MSKMENVERYSWPPWPVQLNYPIKKCVSGKPTDQGLTRRASVSWRELAVRKFKVWKFEVR